MSSPHSFLSYFKGLKYFCLVSFIHFRYNLNYTLKLFKIFKNKTLESCTLRFIWDNYRSKKIGLLTFNVLIFLKLDFKALFFDLIQRSNIKIQNILSWSVIFSSDIWYSTFYFRLLFNFFWKNKLYLQTQIINGR